MANKTINDLQSASTPILGTDKILVSRDGINVMKTTVGSLPLPLTTAQSSNVLVNAVAAITSNGKSVLADGRVITIKDDFIYKPFGFNYYSIAYEKIIGYANSDVARAELLQYAKDCGSNLIRVALPVFSAAEYLTRVHNTGTMPDVVTDSNLRSTFVAAVDAAMDSLATYGQKCLACLLWGQDFTPTAFGETYLESTTNLNSKSAIYSKSFVQWFVNRYKNHAAFGIISLGNEYSFFDRGLGSDALSPTAAQLGTYFSYLATAVRDIRASTLVTADIQLPIAATIATRPTIAKYCDWYKQIFSDLDIITLHSYAEGYNFTGATTLASSSFPNSPSTTLGYEGIRSLLSAVKSFCDAENKKLIIGEFGVGSLAESDTGSAKRKYYSSMLASYADTILLWNLQDTALAATAGDQANWCVDTGTSRATVWMEIAQSINKGKPSLPFVGAGIPGIKNSIKPQFTFGSTRTAGQVVSVTTTSAVSSTTGYSFMCWLKVKSTLNQFEILSRIGTTTSGLVLVGSPSGGTSEVYTDTRRSAGGAGNTAAVLPSLDLNELTHLAFIHTTINGIAGSQVWMNGMYYGTYTATSLADTIPAGTVIKLLGETNGAPIEMQDATLLPYASNDDIWRHMRGEVLPQSLMHIKTTNNGVIYDASINKLSVSVGSGVTIQRT